MKLYNKTKYPDSLIEPLLTEAGKAVNARTSNVIVKVTSAKAGYSHRCYGTAHRADCVQRWFLGARAYTKTSKRTELVNGTVETDKGYFRIVVPFPEVPKWVKNTDIYAKWMQAHKFDGLDIAETIFSVASHEWQHIRQYQHNKYDFRDRQERAKNHDNRVWEKDAIKASGKAISKPRDKAQCAILDFALWIESINK